MSLRIKIIVLVLMLMVLGIQPVFETNPGAAALDGEVALVCTDSRDADRDVELVAAYLENRAKQIDGLLPDARGTTRFVASLNGKAGVAMQDAGIVAIAVDAGLDTWTTAAVELHERAHLLSFSIPDHTARLMHSLPAPARNQYAATNRAEHFAEMAARAWDVVSVLAPDGFCPVGTPAELLRSAEAEVPGTAGFVAWYMRHPKFRAAEGAIELEREAERLLAPHVAEWRAIWSSLESRRRPDGTLQPFERPASLQDRLQLRRAHARLAGGLGGRIDSAQLTLSLALLRLSGRH